MKLEAEQFIKVLSEYDADDTAGFAEIIQGAGRFGLTTTVIAGMFAASVATVDRWASQQTHPMRGARKVIVNEIHRVLTFKVMITQMMLR